MQSVKFCNLNFDTFELGGCADPDVTSLVLVDPNTYNTQPGIIDTNIAGQPLNEGRGVLFGGLTADIWWTHNPVEDNVLNVTSGFLRIFEAIHVIGTNEAGFLSYLPNLSNPAVGADSDVDLVWKRLSMMPVWGVGNDCGAGSCQLSASSGQNPDHIRVKSKRRLNEKQVLTYSVAIAGDNATNNAIGGWPLRFNAWFRIAVRKLS